MHESSKNPFLITSLCYEQEAELHISHFPNSVDKYKAAIRAVSFIRTSFAHKLPRRAQKRHGLWWHGSMETIYFTPSFNLAQMWGGWHKLSQARTAEQEQSNAELKTICSGKNIGLLQLHTRRRLYFMWKRCSRGDSTAPRSPLTSSPSAAELSRRCGLIPVAHRLWRDNQSQICSYAHRK